MKYLEQQKLSHWTACLSNVVIGHSRVMNGRVEVYSRKRSGSDKKYAAKLGSVLMEQIQQEQEMVAAVAAKAAKVSATAPKGRKRSSSAGILREKEKDKNASNKRRRCSSFDQTLVKLPQKRPTALGDFNQQATRRLMTDLILTLNASFPDYDFGAVKTSDFTKVSVRSAVSAITNQLSEWARKQQSTSKNVLEDLWEAINESVPLKECEVYRFHPPDGSLMTTWEEDEDDVNTASTNLWSFYFLFVNKTQKRILLFTATESMKATAISDDDEETEERYIGTTSEVEPDGRFDLDPASTGSIPISSI